MGWNKTLLAMGIAGLAIAGAVLAQDAATGDPAATSSDSAGIDDAPAAPVSGPRGPGGGGPRPQLTDAERQQLQAMTPDQRKAFFDQKHQAHMESLTPEQKAEHAAMRAKHEERMKSMTPEQREAMKERRQAGGGAGFRGGKGPGGGGGRGFRGGGGGGGRGRR